jgi:hypothetical protein
MKIWHRTDSAFFSEELWWAVPTLQVGPQCAKIVLAASCKLTAASFFHSKACGCQNRHVNANQHQKTYQAGRVGTAGAALRPRSHLGLQQGQPLFQLLITPKPGGDVPDDGGRAQDVACLIPDQGQGEFQGNAAAVFLEARHRQ